ncbi:MAG TPA: hypothetical protein VFW07_16915 [Parafilimonas sp.]|nr:hypothetical protein [Parafilimonas sp.]
MKTLLTIIILPVFIFTNTTKLRAQCECTDSMERAELKQIYLCYRDAVNNARDNGYQCGGDTNYIDKGDGKHPVGNCADWAQVTWGIATDTSMALLEGGEIPCQEEIYNYINASFCLCRIL